MRKAITFTCVALGLFAGGLLTSCSQDDMPAINESGNVLVKAPKIVAYSGDTYLDGAQTRSIEPGEKPPYVSYGSQEFNDVKAFFSLNDELRAKGEAPQGGEFLTIGDAFDGWTDYWVQTIEHQTNAPDNFHVLNNLAIWNYVDDAWDIKKWTEAENQYFSNEHMKLVYGKNLAPDRLDAAVKFENFPIVDFSYTTYLENLMAQQYRGKYSYIFGTKPSMIRGVEGTPPYRIAKIDGYDEIYVAFYVQNIDYYTNQFGQGPSGGAAYTPDYGDDKWDVIIKLTKIEELCDFEDCHHPVHELGYCPICVKLGKNTDCTANYQEPEQPGDTPETPEVDPGHNHNNEVEVNLHGAEKNGQYLESHLSIHVRYAGDVEVFIPVPSRYTCNADDLDIVMKHEPNHMVHSATYTLKDSATSPYGELTVSVTVAYEEDGIRITTSGITEDVIAWCAEKCDGDGITFEIWNYYNDPADLDSPLNLSLTELIEYLNQATVRFIGDNLPDYYINAFGSDGAMTGQSGDCTVTIVEDQSGKYSGTPQIGEHLNGSPNNHIYERTN